MATSNNQSTESADSKGLSNAQEMPEGSWRPPSNDNLINVLSVLSSEVQNLSLTYMTNHNLAPIQIHVYILVKNEESMIYSHCLVFDSM